MTIKKMKPVDVVIVGFGWTGAILAKELADEGLEIVALERGGHQTTKETGKYPFVADELAHEQRFKLYQPLKNETVTVRYNSQSTAVPYRQHGSFHLGNGVGGAGLHWNGMHWRALPEDLNIKSHYEERYGKSFVPNNMTIQDYPVTYQELEPHFTFFEEVCAVSGQAGNVKGVINPKGNIFEAPRSKEYPNPPLKSSYGANLFADAARKIGFNPFPIPASNASEPYTNPYNVRLGPCNYCGYCENYACYMYSKASPQTTILPALAQQDNFDLRVHCHVIKIETDPQTKKATGVTYINETGETIFQPAALVLLCAFQVHNVRLLLLSKIGIPYNPVTKKGVVGKNMAYQYGAWGNVILKKDQYLNPFIGAGAVGQIVDDFNGDNFDHTDLGFVGGAYIAQSQTGGRPIGQAQTMPGGPRWGKGWKESIKEGYQRNISMWSSGSVMAYEDAYIDLDPTYKDGFGLPLARFTFTWHENEITQGKFIAKQMEKIGAAMDAESYAFYAYDEGSNWDLKTYQSTHLTGGAITGDNPQNSVVNKYLQSWDVSNLFVYGACNFPQNIAYNPTGLIAALTYFSVDAIKKQYLKNPGPMIDA